jgi:hypothetical protein
MINEIKTIIVNLLENMKLTDVSYGEINTINPLSIKIDQKLIIPNECLILTSTVGLLNNIEDIGDKVTMLRVDKGQKYIILSKVV